MGNELAREAVENGRQALRSMAAEGSRVRLWQPGTGDADRATMASKAARQTAKTATSSFRDQGGRRQPAEMKTAANANALAVARFPMGLH